jgi:hypothetical protein
MTQHLVIRSGPDRGRTIHLSAQGVWNVGRAEDAQVRLNDAHVSRTHCRIETSPGRILLRDCGSSYGTFVNGTRVTQCALRAGDIIRVGDTELSVEAASVPLNLPTLAPSAALAPPSAAPLAVVVTPSLLGRLDLEIPLAAIPLSDADLVSAPQPASNAVPVEDGSSSLDDAGFEVVEEAEPEAVAPSPMPIPARTPAPAPDLPPGELAKLCGQMLGNYRLGARQGVGQSGDVFRAQDVRSGQDVAVKVFRPDFMRDADAVQRFFRGVQTMLPLRHPHLVRLLESGTTGPYCWLAMDYVDGESLVQVIGRIGVAGMLDWRYAYRVGVHIARALCFVHQHQIIHRNLTPRNVLVRHHDKCALLGDLVLAKTVQEDLTPLTRPGELVGDVHYMSPERIHGDRSVDARSDIYSLGALLYALLTGRPPLASTSLADTIAMILQSTPESPRKRQLAISEMFEGVVMKMLAKRPEERFQTAGELMQQLIRVGTFQGVTLD